MRGKVCAVFGCSNNEVEKNARSFFCFPCDKKMFEDPMGHAPLPASLVPHSWKRLFTIPYITVCNEDITDSPVLDLATCNTHLLHSEVMRWILAGIMNLYQLGRAHNMELEGEDQAFHVYAHPWKPWHHVYSMNKVTRARYRKPIVNPDGKYIVRLFYMGCWRRITVDDYLPLDDTKRPLLPMTVLRDEMWPALLTKALLKVASLSWTEDKEVQDFSVMACLTGWHAQVLDLHNVPSRTIWCLCQKLLKADSNNMEDRYTGTKDRTANDLYETSSSIYESNIQSLEAALTDSSDELPGSIFLCAVVHTLPGELFPCVEHPVLITGMKTDTQDEIRPPTPLWKTFRWKKWALEQHIIAPEKSVKSIRMFSSLQNCMPNMYPVASMPSLAEIAPLLHHYEKYRSFHKSTIQSKASIAVLKKERSKSRRQVKPVDNDQETVFPEIWIEFEKLVHCIKRFEIYYKTKSFQYNLKVTDITQIHQEKNTNLHKKRHSMEDKTSLTSITSSENTGKGEANILYLLMDSITCKKFIISLSVLKPGVKVQRKSYRLKSSSTQDEADSNGDNSVPPPTMYYILGESYDCRSTEIQEIKFAIKTVATKCHLLNFNEGLTVIRLWMKLPEVYAIRISSQMPFILGNREVIEEKLASESVSWKQYGTNFSSAFNALSNMKVDSPHHQDLLEDLHKSFLPHFIFKASSHFATKLKRKIHSKFEDALVSLLLEKTDDIDTITKTILKWKWLFHRNDFGTGILIQTKIGDVVGIQGARLSEVKDDSEMRKPSIVEKTLSKDRSELVDTDSKHLQPVPSQYELISFDQVSGIEFLRRMLGNEPELIKYYPFRNDDKNRILFTDYKGVIHNIMEEWIPLVRFVVNVHSDTFPHCALHLSTTLPYGVIELINNDTLQHFPKHFGDIEPSYIPTNRDGYTVFAYGKGEGKIAHDHSWTVRFVAAAQENSQLPHACSWITTNECSPQEPPQLTIKEIEGNYMPNTDNIIFKCTLTLEKTQHLTMRAVMSNNNVEFALRITDEDGDIIREYQASGEIVIPVVPLRGRDFYVIEARVIGKTWILTAEELELVNTLKDKAAQAQLIYRDKMKKYKAPGSSTRTGKRLKSPPSRPVIAFNSNAPHWKLMIVVDEELRSTVTIKKDQRRLEQIEEMKTEWELAKPGRFKKSYEIRQLFLRQDLYSSYLHNYIHEQGLAPGEKTRYLLQHLSFKQSEYQPDTYGLCCPNDRQETSRNKMDEFHFVYDGIRKKFNEINRNQFRNHTLIRKHLLEATDKSKEMINRAYKERNALVKRIEQQLRKDSGEDMIQS